MGPRPDEDAGPVELAFELAPVPPAPPLPLSLLMLTSSLIVDSAAYHFIEMHTTHKGRLFFGERYRAQE